MTSPAPNPLSRIPPPLLFAAAFALGWVLQRSLWPVPPAAALGLLPAIGKAAVLIAALLAGWSVGLFARSRTTLVPHGNSSALVNGGPYRFTRNPMYLSLTLGYLGAALWSGYWLTLPLLLLPLLALQRVIIPMEESQLARRFGPDYEQFRLTVRRWL